ncbi:GAF domain-containing protein [Aestuariivita boseongensis]|uniref:GAF domain-containing protein n=1 Tax=Aestuariivita boseongensis TaxID=1470562 RepID=UPI000680F4C5|nr:GAF domain-containing protein [Aestuariivita boseongensis]
MAEDIATSTDTTAQTAALYDVLRLIRDTRDDQAPVFDAILKSAARLCEAPFAALIIAKPGDAVQQMVAGYGAEPSTVAYYDAGNVPMDPERSFAARAIFETRVIHLHDMCDTDAYRAGVANVVALAEIQGIRTNLFVPLVTTEGGIGCFILFRKEVRPFDEAQIALVKSFADQAVIAIEKARQFRELQNRLAREKATSDVLNVISETLDDERPVFEAILDNAQTLCNAPMSGLILARASDPHQVLAAHRGLFSAAVALFESGQMVLDGDLSYAAKSIVEARLIAHDDMGQSDLYRDGSPIVRSMVDDSGIRSVLFVPLIREKEAIGTITLFRMEVKPFTPEEISLVETFAAQAVIAIENVRQFREVQTRLEREEASREILQVISGSRTDPAPVFDMILKHATHLSGAPLANLCLLDEAGRNWHLAAHRGEGLRHLSVGTTPRPLDSDLTPAVAMRTAQVVHIEDLKKTELYASGDPGRVAMVEREGMRTILCVPLLNHDKVAGCITLFRREVKAFSSDEIALVETFAAQAVIAIENVRQFREVQSRLEREQASAEVLELISQIRDDTDPVFDAILERGARLCGSDYAGLALISEDGRDLVYTAHHGPDLAHSQHGEMRWALDGKSSFAEAIALKRPVRIDDLEDTDLYRAGDPQRVAHVDKNGLHSFMAVPLILKDVAIGAFGIARFSVNPFSEDDRALIEGFAAQAVIAIENVRQFREVQTRLEREAATKQILEVISQSRDDEQPVFDMILEKAARLCDVPDAALMLLNPDSTAFRIRGHWGTARVDIAAEREWQIDAELPIAQCFREACTVHIADMTKSTPYLAGDPTYLKMVDDEGLRTRLCVPLLEDGKAFGVIALSRYETAPFDAGEIELIETFAAQTVIAIKNVRQFKALETLNAELGDRVEAQVSELERMGRLKRFLPEQVADAVVSSGDDAMLSSHRALISALFCDIRGFTAFCETAEPEETIEVLQTYHEEMGKLIAAHGAGVDHRAGDGIMVLFNDPLPCDDPAGDALRLAFAMRDVMADLCKRWRKLGHRLGFGVGISLGYATVGMVGSEGRFHYTASGTAVNLAARLCDMAADGEILLSPRAWIAVEDETEGELVGEVEIKGISAPVEVWRAVAATQ